MKTKFEQFVIVYLIGFSLLAFQVKVLKAEDMQVQAEKLKEIKEFTYGAKSNRDPFWPLVKPTGVINNYESEFLLTDLSLEGILASGNESLAIINGKIIKRNDKIGQFIVSEIESERVILTFSGKNYTLRLKKED